jgi:CRP-like cAMP-binding protein
MKKNVTTFDSTALKTYLQHFGLLTPSEINEFIDKASYKKLKKFDYFIKEGEVCHDVAFIESGTFRSYYVSDKGEEVTYCFMFQNNLMTAFSSFLTARPTQENIQAITDVELLLVSKTHMERLVNDNPGWLHFSKTMAEQQYIEMEQRIFQLQKSDALKRYSDLVESQSDYLQKIPLKYLASYLGITQRHLSRIRQAFAN